MRQTAPKPTLQARDPQVSGSPEGTQLWTGIGEPTGRSHAALLPWKTVDARSVSKLTLYGKSRTTILSTARRPPCTPACSFSSSPAFPLSRRPSSRTADPSTPSWSLPTQLRQRERPPGATELPQAVHRRRTSHCVSGGGKQRTSPGSRPLRGIPQLRVRTWTLPPLSMTALSFALWAAICTSPAGDRGAHSTRSTASWRTPSAFAGGPPGRRCVPKRPTLNLPNLNVLYVPKLQCREAYYRDAFDGVYAARSKCNGNADRVPPEYGGHYTLLGWCHTFYQLLPPEKYFAQHPDWYSLINGKRQTDGATALSNQSLKCVRSWSDRLWSGSRKSPRPA